jgi:hypothetical protein
MILIVGVLYGKMTYGCDLVLCPNWHSGPRFWLFQCAVNIVGWYCGVSAKIASQIGLAIDAVKVCAVLGIDVNIALLQYVQKVSLFIYM